MRDTPAGAIRRLLREHGIQFFEEPRMNNHVKFHVELHGCRTYFVASPQSRKETSIANATGQVKAWLRRIGIEVR